MTLTATSASAARTSVILKSHFPIVKFTGGRSRVIVRTPASLPMVITHPLARTVRMEGKFFVVMWGGLTPDYKN